MITIEHLTKYYGDFMAVNDLSFEIEEGHVYGFLGPNGAGKSTTMNIMTGCLSATDGTVKIYGHDIFEEPQMAKKLMKTAVQKTVKKNAGKNREDLLNQKTKTVQMKSGNPSGFPGKI